MANIVKIDVTLAGMNRSRLENKEYTKDYTPVPNTAMPDSLVENLSIIYKALSGSELPLDDNTFLVKSEGGKFKKLFTPVVVRESEELDSVVIRWGNELIPLEINEDGIKAVNGAKKLKIKLTREKLEGYEKTCLSVSYSQDGNIYNMVFPIRAVDFEDTLDVDELENLLDENPQEISARIGVIKKHDGSNNFSGTLRSLEGDYILKASSLPENVSFTVLGYRRYKNNYGVQHMLQLDAGDNSFKAEARFKDEETDEYVSREVMVEGLFKVKANSRLNKLLMAKPNITPENPSVLKVISKGEFNGYVTANVKLEVNNYINDVEGLSVDF